MELFRETIPYLVSVATLVVGWLGGRRKSKAETEAIEADSVKKLLETNEEFIVEPIKREINALRKEVRKLQKSIERIRDCPHADGCPVRHELQKHDSAGGNE